MSKPFFSSDRERRLWAWTLAVVVAIFSTLGLAANLAGRLRDRGLIAEFFFFCLLLVVAASVTQGLKHDHEASRSALPWALQRSTSW